MTITYKTFTLRELLLFQTDNHIDRKILDDMKYKLDNNLYYLGGQIKINYDEKIGLDMFDKVREIIEKRKMEYDFCNSFEIMSVNNYLFNLEQTRKIAEKYLKSKNEDNKNIKLNDIKFILI